MDKLYRLIRLLYICGFFLLSTWNVHAYVDPSVMTYAIQAVAGVLITLGTFLGIYWRKIRRRFSKYIQTDANKTMESDSLEFHDPVTGETVSVKGADYAVHTDTQKKTASFSLKELIPAVYIAFSFSFLFAVYAPLEIYMTNVWDFWFDIQIIFPIICKVFLLLFIAAMLIFVISRILWVHFYQIVLGLGVICLICTYIQGNFLSYSLPLLDGTDINWTRYYNDMAVSMVLFAVVTALVIMIIRFLGVKFLDGLARISSLLITFITVISLIIMMFSTGGYKHKNYSFVTAQNEFTMSKNKNLIVFVIDCVDEKKFEEVLYSDPEYLQSFNDFTLFTNVICPYPYTSESIPYIMNPIRIKSRESIRDYHERAVNNSPLFDELYRNDYLIDVYENSIVWDRVNIERFDNIYYEKPIVKDSRALMAGMVKFSWFKYAPFYLKPLVYVSMDEINYTYDLDFKSNNEKFYDVNNQFYDQMRKTDVSYTDQNTFKFIHIEGAHAPFRYDKDVNVIETSEGTYQKNIQCSLTILKEYMEKLKEAGVYDNTALVFLSDHGFNPEINPETNRVRAIGRQHPILLIKGINEKGSELKQSAAPLTYEDFQEAYIELLNNTQSDNLFKWAEGEQRDREYYFYDNTIQSDIEVQIFHGDAEDLDLMERTGIMIEYTN